MPVVMFVCTFIFLNFAFSLYRITFELEMLHCHKTGKFKFFFFFILIKLFHVVFLSIINNIYLQKHFKTGSCDVPEGPKGMNLQNYLTCIFLLTKDLYKINLSFNNELLPSLDIWQRLQTFVLSKSCKPLVGVNHP